MADTCADIINAAYVEAEIYDDDTPADATDARRGLRILQGIYDSLVAEGTFGRFRATLITGDHTMGEGERVGYSGATSAVITLPVTVQAWCDPWPYGSEWYVSTTGDNVDSTNRAPRDLTLAEIAGDPVQTFVYNAGLGDYQALRGLLLPTTAPLCDRFGSQITDILTYELARKAQQPAFLAARNLAKHVLATNPSAPRTETIGSYF